MLIERRLRWRISQTNMAVPQNVDALYKAMANAYSAGENPCLVLSVFFHTNGPKYTAADMFFNPTYEDNYSTANLEAEACGTRVVTYDTGGCRETIHSPESVVIPVGAYQKLQDLV